MKISELAEKAKLICLIRERSTATFVSNWKHNMVLFLKKEEYQPVIEY